MQVLVIISTLMYAFQKVARYFMARNFTKFGTIQSLTASSKIPSSDGISEGQ